MKGFNKLNGKVRVRFFWVVSLVVFVLVAISLDCAVVKILQEFLGERPDMYMDTVMRVTDGCLRIAVRIIAVSLCFCFWWLYLQIVVSGVLIYCPSRDITDDKNENK